MTKNGAESEQQEFLEFIRTYQYIDDAGRLDLERFCVYLSSCFAADGSLEGSPQPRNVYNLLLEIIEDSNPGELASWVGRQKLLDWTPELSQIYPDGIRTLVHFAALVKFGSEWIYRIGRDLMGVAPPEARHPYSYWVKSDSVFVYSFIKGFHEDLWSLAKATDRESFKEKGFSLIEVLAEALKSDAEYAEVRERLQVRGNAFMDALGRIDEAIEAGYHLEAITLEECLISNCLYNYLKAISGNRKVPTTLQELIKASKDKERALTGKYSELFDSLDDWRRDRNKAIHGFISSRTKKLQESGKQFSDFSRTAAHKGRDLCRDVIEWYAEESVARINTGFPGDRSAH